MGQYKLSCGCVPDASGYGWCDACCKALKAKIWREMSEKDRNYDRRFGGKEIAVLDAEYNTGCSCHINPPCSYCTSKNEENE